MCLYRTYHAVLYIHQLPGHLLRASYTKGKISYNKGMMALIVIS